jgi:serine/threonine protein kinase
LGKLVQTRGTITEPYVKIMARQLIDALGYLHDNKITHRDVKPDNILVQSTDPFVVKLTDFGLSKMIDTEQTFLKTFCGTLLYCAPEVYSEYSTYDEKGRRVRKDRKPANRERYDHAVDVWSLGGVLYYALTGSPPFPVRNGTTYTELLHVIMTNPLDVEPLVDEKVSDNGIHFLARMINRRPETRATITELQDHSWLTAPDVESDDEISDDGLEQGASQLSLYDRQGDSLGDIANDGLLEPAADLSMAYDDKENYTFGQPPPDRLWGEVNNSAIGSSGAIAEERLNIPMSGDSFGETDGQEYTILDSFESEDLSTPRQRKSSQRTHRLFSSNSTIDENTFSIAQAIGSQSLGGDSGILENLNVKSTLARATPGLHSGLSDLNTSKRKPGFDTSDEFDSGSSNPKPSFKRLKSRTDESMEDADDDQCSLLASVPKAGNSASSRLIDYPVDKRTFWDAADKQTWHLNYPEMTGSQLEAFKSAAECRNEEFVAGQTPLWNVAMEWFPPTKERPEGDDPLPDTRIFLRRDSRSIVDSSAWDVPATAPPPASDDELISLPDTIPPDTGIPRQLMTTSSTRRVVARLTSSIGSLIRGVTINLTDPILSWGRAPDNTTIYRHAMEMKVPKHAFRILLWREGYAASSSDFRPWDRDRNRSPDSTSSRASPEPDAYGFYISTKATNGLRINNNPLVSYEPKNNKAPSKHWMKLYHGDTVVFWGNEDVNNQAKLTFECFWGGSAALRPTDEPPTCVPDTVSRKLDSIWTKAEDHLSHDRIKDDAMEDAQYRMKHMDREQERSKKFEVRRAEAARIVALRNSRQSSPMNAPPPPTIGRTVPRCRQGSSMTGMYTHP